MMSDNRRRTPPSLPELIERAEKAIAEFWETAADSDRGGNASSRSAGFGFLMTEVDTGSTFARIALDAAADSTKARRNTLNARKAYDTILRFRDRAQMHSQESHELSAGVEGLRTQLQSLGEEV